MAAGTDYDPKWFAQGSRWGWNRSLIGAGIGLRSYRTHERLKQTQSNDRRRVFACAYHADGCFFELTFSQRTRIGWIVTKSTPHMDTCPSLNPTPEYIKKRWGDNTSTLVSVDVLSDLCRPVLLAQTNDLSILVPSQVAVVLRDREWLPPLWDQRQRSGAWLNSLSHCVRDALLNTSEPVLVMNSLTEQLEAIQANRFQGPTHPQKHQQQSQQQQQQQQQQQEPPVNELDYLQSFKTYFEARDPDNRLTIVTQDVDGRQVYVASYFVLGAVKRLATHQHSSLQFEIDVSYFQTNKRKLRVPGTMQTVVYIDAAAKVFPLLVSHDSRRESGQACTDLIDAFYELFPAETRPKVAFATDCLQIFVDNLHQRQRNGELNWVFKHGHLAKKLQSVFPKQKKLAVSLFRSIALAETVEGNDYWKERTRKEMPALLDFLGSYSESMYTKSRYPSAWLDVAADAVKSFWMPLFRQHIVMVDTVAMIYSRVYTQAERKLDKARQDHKGFVDPITKWASSALVERKNKSAELSVQSVDGFAASVSDSYSRAYACDLQTRECPCQARRVHSVPCRHLFKLAEHLGALTQPLTLFADCFAHESWRQAMKAAKPYESIDFGFADEQKENPFEQPDYSGKGAKKTKQQQQKKTTPGKPKQTSLYCQLMGIAPETLMHTPFDFSLPPPMATQLDGPVGQSLYPAYAQPIPDGWQFPPPLGNDALDSLRPGTWLNDQVISWAVAQQAERSIEILAKDPFFLSGDAPLGLKSQHRMVLLPIHQPARQHWVLFVIFPRLSQVIVLDSMFGSKEPERGQLLQHLSAYSATEWQHFVPKVPHQTNSFDCGAFVLAYAECVARKPIPQTPLTNEEWTNWFSNEEYIEASQTVATIRQRLWHDIFRVSTPPAAAASGAASSSSAVSDDPQPPPQTQAQPQAQSSSQTQAQPSSQPRAQSSQPQSSRKRDTPSAPNTRKTRQRVQSRRDELVFYDEED